MQVDHGNPDTIEMLKIVGYTDRWVYAPGEEIGVKVSTEHQNFYAHLIRHTGPINDPHDWTTNAQPVGGSYCGPHPGRSERTISGSYFVGSVRKDIEGEAVMLSMAIYPTSVTHSISTIATLDFRSFSVALSVANSGGVYATLVNGQNTRALPFRSVEFTAGRWHKVRLALNLATGVVSLCSLQRGREAIFDSVDFERLPPARTLDRLVLAGKITGEGVVGDYDGKIETPTLTEFLTGPNFTKSDGALGKRIARWDFSDTTAGSFTVSEQNGIVPPARLVNAPTRAITSSSFDGRNADFNQSPGSFDAIWFHRDDLADACWKTTFVMKSPEETSGGVYSIILSPHSVVDWHDRENFDAVPVFVRPSPASSNAKIALILPTFSYRAYANNTFAEEADPRIFKLKKRSSSRPLYEYAIGQNLLSLYSVHGDGSGVCLASLKRPQTTIRADFDSQLQGFHHQFSADLSIVGWLNSLNIPFHILTDEILHEEGFRALDGYDVVVTGSHPEYASSALLDAYDGYAASGGSIMYLGGNGFYWSVGTSPDFPELLEVRRTEGTRTWTAGIGERRQQLDGRDGGIWRSLGRPPNRTFGIGFSAHGFSGDGSYRRAPSLDTTLLPTRTRDFFSKIGTSTFGIAGLEIDRYAPEFGSELDVLVLAMAEGLPDGYLPTVEELGGLDVLIQDPSKLVRGDIIFRRHPGGGLIFSVGSIRWSSGLDDVNDRSRVRELTTTVLFDFLDDARTENKRAQQTSLDAEPW